MQPDVKVCCQLDFPMLNKVVQVPPTREKPSPGAAGHDQTMLLRRTPRREHLI